MRKAVEYGKSACDTMMNHYQPAELPPVKRFHYHQGVFLSGMEHIYKLCGEEKYAEYIKEWVDSFVNQDGTINNYSPAILDDIQPGILLYGVYDRNGDKRYKNAIDNLIGHLREWKCNEYGGYWHRDDPKCNQMWLDSLYMSGPIQAEYARRYNEPEMLNTVIRQVIIMKEHIQDKDTGLLRHAWDPYLKARWCDADTGLAPEIWGRAQGWYIVSVMDILEQMPENHPERETLVEIAREIAEAIVKYQESETGMWYQVIDKPYLKNNWLETSCSCLFSYAMAKGVRLGILEKKYINHAMQGYRGVINTAIDTYGNDLLVQRVCIGTGVGSYKFYINRPTTTNDLHGVGAFILMCAEIAQHE